MTFHSRYATALAKRFRVVRGPLVRASAAWIAAALCGFSLRPQNHSCFSKIYRKYKYCQGGVISCGSARSGRSSKAPEGWRTAPRPGGSDSWSGERVGGGRRMFVFNARPHPCLPEGNALPLLVELVALASVQRCGGKSGVGAAALPPQSRTSRGGMRCGWDLSSGWGRGHLKSKNLES